VTTVIADQPVPGDDRSALGRGAGVRRSNAWHAAICEQLRVAGGPLLIKQIWARLEASGFQHASRLPRSTLGARVAELVQMKKLSRVGPATYQLLTSAPAPAPAPAPTQQEVSP
jgi:hypothetical protein